MFHIEDKETYERIKRDRTDAKERMDKSIEAYGATCLTLKNEFEHLEKINKMRGALPNAKFVRIDSHMKIAVCEKYVLYGSQNMMSYRYKAGKKDIRSEITIKDTDAREIEEFKKIIEREVGKRVRLRW